MSMSLEAASEVMRQVMRETVKRHSLWYLIQGGLMILAGVLAIVYPVLSSVAVVIFLGWLLIISGVVQAISVIGARASCPADARRDCRTCPWGTGNAEEAGHSRHCTGRADCPVNGSCDGLLDDRERRCGTRYVAAAEGGTEHQRIN